MGEDVLIALVKKVCPDNCLSVTNPELIKEWDYEENNKLNVTPQNVRKSSKKKLWWICVKNHKWQASLNSRTNKENGCPICRESKGEKIISSFLGTNRIEFKRQYRCKECKKKKPLSFDFMVTINKNIFLVEYNGIQHYKIVSFGSKNNIDFKKRFSLIRQRDKIKKVFCSENKIPLLIIPYWDFENIEKLLSDFIKDFQENKNELV